MKTFTKWMTYLNERSPLPALIFISSGIALSGMAYVGSFDLTIFFLGIILNVIVLIQMRLGDEIKDFEKDKIMHPNRPLPRGLLTVREVYLVLVAVFIIILISGLIIGARLSWWGGLSLLSTTVFAWLMFKEFYVGHFLSKEPLTYAFTHQLIVFPIHAWVALTMDTTLKDQRLFIGWLLANFGASFTFELCRKLDPNAHILAGTYAQHYGRPLTALFLAVFVMISAYGTFLADYHTIAWPLLSLLIIMAITWVVRPMLYKVVFGLSALSSTFILWTPAFKWLISRWG